jgi:hypothetical protein
MKPTFGMIVCIDLDQILRDNKELKGGMFISNHACVGPF